MLNFFLCINTLQRILKNVQLFLSYFVVMADQFSGLDMHAKSFTREIYSTHAVLLTKRTGHKQFDIFLDKQSGN